MEEFIVQYQGPYTDWIRTYLHDGWDEVYFLPIAGNIGLVKMLTADDDLNCILNISFSRSVLSSGPASKTGSAGIILTLIATRNIKSGEVLLLEIKTVV